MRLIRRAIVHSVHYRNPKRRLGLQNQKTISLLIAIIMPKNNQTDRFVYQCDLKTTIFEKFLSQRLNYKIINSDSQKISKQTIAKFTTSKKTDITLLNKVKKLRAITICSTLTRNYLRDNRKNKLIGNVQCSNELWSGKLRARKIFRSPGRSVCQCPECTSTCQVRNSPFEDQLSSFLLKCDQGFHFFEETQE